MPIIILFLLSGFVASALVGLLLTKPLMVRGFRTLGFWSGLFALIIVFGTGQYYFANYYRSSFIETGPCSTCCELCGLTFLFWWISWGIGFIVYLVISAVFNKRYSEITPLPTPQWLKISVPIGIFCIIVGVMGFSLWKDNLERTHLRTNIVLIENSVLLGDPIEFGSIQLPQAAKYWTLGNISYVNGIKFSPDGKWFSLQYKDKVEIWRISDITPRKVFLSGPSIRDSIIAFGPDSSNFSVWIEGKLSVYSLADAIKLVWEFDEVKNSVSDLGFSEDGKELVVANTHEIETFDANNGNHLQTVAMPGKDRFYYNRLSNNSEYVVTGNEKVFQLYNRHNGQLLHEIEKPRGILLPNNDVLFLDCERSRVEIWDEETGDEVSFDVVGDYCWPSYYVAFTLDSNASVLAGLHNFVILDLKNKIQIDSIPIQPAITALAISPDGHMIIVATADGRLNFYANMMSEN